MRSFLFVTHPKFNYKKGFSPIKRLRELGCNVYAVNSDLDHAKDSLQKVDGAILRLSMAELETCAARLLAWKRLPIIWWCDEATASQSGGDCSLQTDLDGLVSPGMSDSEMQWSLYLSSKQFYDRIALRQERQQLLSRLEERKWVERAKGIICQIKQIPEADAYDYLRKQAMNERKRMFDVAVSIVKVYQLLQEQKN